MKGVSLSNAVVILDEPQALPMRWWPAVERTCRLLTDELGATIISMTATQPPLFNADDIETASLVPSTSSYQERFERVSYNIDESVWDYGAPDRNSSGPLSHTDAANRVTDSLSETDGSVLAVCNTIASARTLYEQIVRGLGEPIRLGERIKAKLRTWTPESSKHLRDPDKVIERTRHALESDTEGDIGLSGAAIAPSPTELVAGILDDLELNTMEPRIPVVACLTGEHRPYDKRILIELIEKLATSERPLIVVSTQVIEAGVDVSFRTVYRDHAPIPSLVQSAGRCNRSFEWGEGGGEVTFWQLAGNESGLLPARIYERRQLKNHLEIVSEVLRDICETPQSVSEQTIAVNAVEAYYDVLSENGVGDQNLVKWIDEFRGADLAKERLIEDIETVDLIAPQTIRERTVAMAVRKAFEQEQLSVGYHLLELLQDCRVSAKPRTDAFSQATQPIAPDIDQLENVVSPVSMNGELYTPEYGVGGTTLK
jgi:CRISPR-associated endonuclease/helicase Cas3/CRISPR-associated endonuclease Cas3-HD